MKIQLQYSILVTDNDGKPLVDAEAKGTFHDLGSLVKSVAAGMKQVEGILGKDDEFNAAMAAALNAGRTDLQ